MAYAVKQIGLEPYVVGATNRHVLNSTIYAYARCKIPTILGITLFDGSLEENYIRGRHAVAVTGFSLGLTAPIPEPNTGFLLRASCIDKLYAHDDQVEPFARMTHQDTHLDTSWPGDGPVLAVPYILVLPLYNKIRIPFSFVHDGVLSFDGTLELARQDTQLPRLEWDIYLTTVNSFKEDILCNSKDILKNKTADVLTHSFPRFLWRATAYIGEDKQLDLLFDATGIEQQKLIELTVEYTPFIRMFVEPLIQSGILSQLKIDPQARAIFEQFDTQKSIRAC